MIFITIVMLTQSILKMIFLQKDILSPFWVRIICLETIEDFLLFFTLKLILKTIPPELSFSSEDCSILCYKSYATIKETVTVTKTYIVYILCLCVYI